MMVRELGRASRAKQLVPVAEREDHEKRALVFNQSLRHMKVKRPSSEIYRPGVFSNLDGIASLKNGEFGIEGERESGASGKRSRSEIDDEFEYLDW